MSEDALHPQAEGPLADEPVDVEVTDTQRVFDGAVWDVVRETFVVPEADEPLTRDLVLHTGAVAIAAVDEADRILLIQQYRHPIRTRDWEVPAGLRDIADEQPWIAAARELGEETDLEARDWATLADLHPTPGGSSELIRIYLARGIRALPQERRTPREGEESGIVPRWVPLDEALEAVLAGRVRNAAAALAILHADHARARGYSGLRPVDAPWPAPPGTRRD